jgi:glycosyl transferase family 61/glycosyl transferase family 92
MKHSLAICAIVKNEFDYLLEWIAYHRVVGVDHFLIYNNSGADDDGTTELLNKLHGIGAVDLVPWPDRPDWNLPSGVQVRPQIPAYYDGVDRLRDKAEWVALIDADEFIVPMKEEDLPSTLKQFERFGGVGPNWRMFGSSGAEKKEDALVCKRFTMASFRETFANHHVKTIAKPELIRKIHTHRPFLENGTFVDEHGREISDERGIRPSVSYDIIRINHYFTKSRQEWLEKVARGRAATPGKRPADFFHQVDHNDESDTFILKFYDATVKGMQELALAADIKDYPALRSSPRSGQPKRSPKSGRRRATPAEKRTGRTSVAVSVDENEKSQRATEGQRRLPDSEEPAQLRPRPKRLETFVRLFDEEFYLHRYKDVARAVSGGGLKSGLDHYIRHGFREGREPFAFDRVWYSTEYPLAVLAVERGEYSNLIHHYVAVGASSGYRPVPKGQAKMKAHTTIVSDGHADTSTFDFASPSAADLTESSIFLSKEGIAYDESGTVLPFSFLSMPRQHLERALQTSVENVFEARRRSPVARREHLYVPGLVPGYSNYYHLLIDCVPRILLSLQTAGAPARILVTSFQAAQLQREMGNLLTQVGDIFGFRDWLEIVDGDLLHLERAIVPKQNVRFIGSTIQLFQDIAARSGRSNRRGRVYVSRRLTTARRVLNEAEVITTLRDFGFEPLCLEQMSLEEQIKVFRESEVIIGPHGAGLANIVFSNPGTTLIEFLQDCGLYKARIFSELTALTGGRHVVLSSKSEGDPHRRVPPSNVDMSVNCSGLRTALKSLLG